MQRAEILIDLYIFLRETMETHSIITVGTFSKMVENQISPKLENEIGILMKKGFQNFEDEREIAEYLVTTMNKKDFPHWQCVVGRSYGSCINSLEKNHFYKQFGPFYVEMWKC